MHDVRQRPSVDLCASNSTEQIVTALAAQGITILHGASTRDDLLRMARCLMTIRPHRDSGPDGGTTIAARPEPADGPSQTGLTDRELLPHTEGTAVDRPPRVLMLVCIQPAPTGGRSYLVDGCDLYDEIASAEPALMVALSAADSARFGRPAGHIGPVFQHTIDGRVTVRLRFDEPDGFSLTVAPHIDRLRRLVEQHAIALDLRPGQGYVLLNDRWLHGRSKFTGSREMLRIIGDPPSHHQLPVGFRPAMARSPIQPVG